MERVYGGVIVPSRTDIIIKKAIKLVKEKLNHIDSSHGINHALAVLNHVKKALELLELSEEVKLQIMLAALLHDVDDGKYFTGTEYENAKNILNALGIDPDTIIKMISLVSCSENGDAVSSNTWELYPRYADRLEAIGKIGIVRCYLYTKHLEAIGKGRPLFTENTPRAKNLTELYNIATSERYANYVNKKGKVGNSTFIDHFYDKLLHFNSFGDNPYFCEKAKKRLKIIQDFIIDFGITGSVNENLIESWRIKYGY